MNELEGIGKIYKARSKFQLYKQSFISIDSKNTGKGRVILAMKKSLRMTEGSISQKIIFLQFHCFWEICSSNCIILLIP